LFIGREHLFAVPRTKTGGFAGHLGENGTDIKYLREMPGHCYITTTLRCAHAGKKTIANIESPLDKINRKNGKE
jgi:integrase/recombinase XerD